MAGFVVAGAAAPVLMACAVCVGAVPAGFLAGRSAAAHNDDPHHGALATIATMNVHAMPLQPVDASSHVPFMDGLR